MGNYPGSIDWKIRAKTYGPLPTHDRTNVALVLHTTETSRMPSFSGKGNPGDVAPHYAYDLKTRQWTMWAEPEDGYVGTIKGHSTGHYNCKAIQVEMIGYSNGDKGSPWVGDATEDNYQDLADFYKWTRELHNVGPDLTPTPPGGWKYGVDSPYRLTENEWEKFSGLTGHGAVPKNTHWDPGVLDLKHIYVLSYKEEPPVSEPSINKLGRDILYVREGDEGWEVEYWQVMAIIAVKGIPFVGNSNRSFIAEFAPLLTFKLWDKAMTAYVSGFTGRNSYGIGPTERIMIEQEVAIVRRDKS